jgi:hypothetical protein
VLAHLDVFELFKLIVNHVLHGIINIIEILKHPWRYFFACKRKSGWANFKLEVVLERADYLII